MIRRNSFAVIIGIVLAAGGLLLRTAADASQESSAIPKPSSVVKPQTYVSLEPVPRGKEFQVAVVAEIARGFHMNSNHPSDAYLIPTTLTVQLPNGIKLLDTIYPDGHAQKFSFSPDKPLDVYSGSVTIKLRLLAQPGATLGTVAIPMTLRYQACNDSTCLPPVKLPVEAKAVVAEAGAKARAAHSEIFSANTPAPTSK
jgi:DsbC/DsbD-like thiol-disulfide interchange protein